MKIRLDLAEIYRIFKNVYLFVCLFVCLLTGWFFILIILFVCLLTCCFFYFHHLGTPKESYPENFVKIWHDLAEILTIAHFSLQSWDKRAAT